MASGIANPVAERLVGQPARDLLPHQAGAVEAARQAAPLLARDPDDVRARLLERVLQLRIPAQGAARVLRIVVGCEHFARGVQKLQPRVQARSELLGVDPEDERISRLDVEAVAVPVLVRLDRPVDDDGDRSSRGRVCSLF